MPIPASINDLSTTAGSNSPAGSESPSLIDDYLRTYASYIAQVRDGMQGNAFNYAVAGGSANAITATYSPAVTALSDSTVLLVKAASFNTGATTFSPNGLTPKPIVGVGHTALAGGEIVANGDVCLQYNSSIGGGSWVLISSSGGALPVPVAGLARNVRMYVSAASSTATITADEVCVEVVAGGLGYKLAAFSKTINLTINGVGGLDTGSTPGSGYVGIYAIYNPSTATSALLAVNATSVAAPNIYGGANMPSGYTASALLTVVATNASSQLVPVLVSDRDVFFHSISVLSTTAVVANLTALSIAAAAPLNAKAVSGTITISTGGAGTWVTTIAGSAITTSTGIGLVNASLGSGSTSLGAGYPLKSIPLVTPQTIYYSTSTTAGSSSTSLAVSHYSI